MNNISIVQKAVRQDTVVIKNTIFRYAPDSIQYKTIWSYDNIKHADGRINSGEDRNGKIIAYTVPVEAPQFWSNIEEGVKPTVKIMVDKGYLPISSCEGHDGARLFIRIAFPVSNKLDIFRDKICSLFKFFPFVKIVEESSICNIKTSNDSVENVGKHLSSLEEAMEFNTLFNKNHRDWVSFRIMLFHEFSSSKTYLFIRGLIERAFRKQFVKLFNIQLSKLPSYKEL